MKKRDLKTRVKKTKNETKEALQIVYDLLNKGQKQKLTKNEEVKKLFDRYGVEY